MAVDTFRVTSTLGNEIDWPIVEDLVASAVSGRLAIDARLAERARTYRPGRRPPVGLAQEVRVFDDASSSATVIEVVGPDRVGLLSRLTRALSDMDLDIRTAKVATLGHDVVDTFYVTGDGGQKVTDVAHLAEIRVAILHELDRADM
jgi:[protein-PII] uridylyltransferase